jgi:hypothetical protein
MGFALAGVQRPCFVCLPEGSRNDSGKPHTDETGNPYPHYRCFRDGNPQPDTPAD